MNTIRLPIIRKKTTEHLAFPESRKEYPELQNEDNDYNWDYNEVV
jgi:hypothetical protein